MVHAGAEADAGRCRFGEHIATQAGRRCGGAVTGIKDA
jgi:hypothetical protein